MKRSEYLRNSYNEAKNQIYKDFAAKFMKLKTNHINFFHSILYNGQLISEMKLINGDIHFVTEINKNYKGVLSSSNVYYLNVDVDTILVFFELLEGNNFNYKPNKSSQYIRPEPDFFSELDEETKICRDVALLSVLPENALDTVDFDTESDFDNE